MKTKYQISLFVIITLLIINSSLAASYSLWIVSKPQTGENLISSGCFEVAYNDKDANNESTSVGLLNTYPISDEKGVVQKPYRVTLTNTCSIDADYKLVISELQGNTLDKNYVRYKLSNSEETSWGPSAFGDLPEYVMESSTKSDIENESGRTIKNSYLLATGGLKPQETITYEFRMWVQESTANSEMNKQFDALISMDAWATNIQS